MAQNLFCACWLIPVLLFIFCCVALFLRIGLAYEQIFAGDIVKFATKDAYYFLRQLDNFVYNFPHLISFDPYLNYPTGFTLGSLNFFVYLLGSITWLLGMGSPSPHMMDLVGAYFPAVVGALTVIPVYFICKTIFDRKAAVVAAALIAILPGELLGRSTLGATDRDALEVLLTTTTILFFIMAVNSARERQITFRLLRPHHLPVLTRPLIFSLLAGLMLSLSLFTWRGSFLFVLIILVYFIVRAIIHHLRNESFDYLSIVSMITILVTILIFGAVSRNWLYSAALIISLLIPMGLWGIAWVLKRWRIKAIYLPLAAIGSGLIGLGILYTASPAFFRAILEQFSVFISTPTSDTVNEMASILFTTGYFTLTTIWANYTTGLYLSLISLGILIYLSAKQSESRHMFIIIWSLTTLATTLVMRRFAIFFAVNVALLTGYAAVIIYYAVQFIINRATGRSNDNVLPHLSGALLLKTPALKPVRRKPLEFDCYQTLGIPIDATHKQIKKAYHRLTSQYQYDTLTDEDKEKLEQLNQAYAVLSDPRHRDAYNYAEYGAAKRTGREKTPKASALASPRINIAIAGVVIFFMVFFPNLRAASTTLSQVKYLTPSDTWHESLCWLKDNTPEPFGDPGYYYELYETPFQYPETAYGVIAWWDYGYWILRTGQRLPVCDPGGGSREEVARFLTSQDEALASEIVKQLNSKYIIIDYETVIGKFNTIAVYAGDNGGFYNVYYQQQDDKTTPVLLFYPEYYRSLGVRLYNFDGAEVIPENTTVISYKEDTSDDGQLYRAITSAQSFPSYEEASAFISSQKSGNYRIVSHDPLISPVPLDPLQHYQLVHSNTSATMPSFHVFSELGNSVKIFEYTP